MDPHPLAGKCGTGPPIAPEHWRWRAGTRSQDMYFTSPSGLRFRSRKSLNEYLAEEAMTGGDPPLPSSFQWRVTEEFLADNHVICEDVESQRGGTPEGGPGYSRRRSHKKKKEAQRRKRIKVTELISKAKKKGHVRAPAKVMDIVEEQVRLGKKKKANLSVVKVLEDESSVESRDMRVVRVRAKEQRKLTMAKVMEKASEISEGRTAAKTKVRKDPDYVPTKRLNPQKTKAQIVKKLHDFKSSIVLKQDERELSNIHSSMTTLLNAVRVRRQALEAAEMKLIGLLTESQKKLGEIGEIG
ncbi:hypothetical protein R1sor_012347 [Riccia sorocarpa]|uniref:MBD domain-containing protein n=1 Tax=Riccia sorocarpa TaxID=122646 RepID=A0ABD3I4A4_9MARC